MRDIQVDGKRIRIEVYDDEMVLNRIVHAWFEYEKGERLAYSILGVKKVMDKIAVMS